VPNLTEADLTRMRQRLDELLASLRSGDVATVAMVRPPPALPP